MSAKELLFSQYSKDNIEKQNDIYAINHLIQGHNIEEVPEQKAVEVQALNSSVYIPSRQKSQNIVIEPTKDGFKTLIEDKNPKSSITKDSPNSPKEIGDAKELGNAKETKGPDFIERFYYASLTVVGLYVLFRMIQKTK